MTDPVPNNDKQKPDQGVPESAIPANIGELTTNDTIGEENNPQAARQKANYFLWQPLRRILGLPKEYWESLKDSAVSNRTIAVATVVVAIATAFTWWDVDQGSKQTDRIVAASESIQRSIRRGNRQNKTAFDSMLGQSQDAMNKTLIEMQKQSAAMESFAGTAKLQAQISKEAAKEAVQASHISERAYLSIGAPMLDMDKGLVSLPIDNGGKIPSGEAVATIHEATVVQIDDITPIPVTNTIGKYWTRTTFPYILPGNPITIAEPVRAFSKSQVASGQQIILIAGTLRYKDGFPDDPEREWPFCFQSIKHLVMQQTIWTPCDIKTIIPMLERLDGYPNSKQNAN